MTNIDQGTSPDSALAKLCADTLTTIATPPGRIYDKHALIVTPIDEMKRFTKITADTTKSLVDASKPLIEAAAKSAKP